MWVQGTGLPRATGASGVGLDSLQMAQSSLIGLSACVSILARSLTTWTPDPLVAVASTTRPQFFQIERPKKICDLLDPRKRGSVILIQNCKGRLVPIQGPVTWPGLVSFDWSRIVKRAFRQIGAKFSYCKRKISDICNKILRIRKRP